MSNIVVSAKDSSAQVGVPILLIKPLPADETVQIMRGIKDGLKSSGQTQAADITGIAASLYSLHRKLGKGSDLENRLSDPEISTLAGVSVSLDVMNLSVLSARGLINLTRATQKVAVLSPVMKTMGPIATALRLGGGVVDYNIAAQKYDVAAGERAIGNTVGGIAGGIAGGMAGVKAGGLVGAFLGAVIPVVGSPLGATIGAGVGGVVGSVAGTWGGGKVGQVIVHETMGDWLSRHFRREARVKMPHETGRVSNIIPLSLQASQPPFDMLLFKNNYTEPMMCPI